MPEERLTVNIAGSIWSDKQLAHQVAEANVVLREVIGEIGAPTTARWSLVKDEKDRPLLHLVLSDFRGQVEKRYAPEDLDNPRDRFEKLWGNLLGG